MKLAEIRRIMEENKIVGGHYAAMIDAANDYLNSNIQVIQDEDPEQTTITDEQIIKEQKDKK